MWRCDLLWLVVDRLLSGPIFTNDNQTNEAFWNRVHSRADGGFEHGGGSAAGEGGNE